jgi:hypothetical protein
MIGFKYNVLFLNICSFRLYPLFLSLLFSFFTLFLYISTFHHLFLSFYFDFVNCRTWIENFVFIKWQLHWGQFSLSVRMHLCVCYYGVHPTTHRRPIPRTWQVCFDTNHISYQTAEPTLSWVPLSTTFPIKQFFVSIPKGNNSEGNSPEK